MLRDRGSANRGRAPGLSRRVGLLVVAVALAGAASVTTVAFADHDGAGEIHACARDDQPLRFVRDPSRCRAGERPISWNRQGPPGPKGDMGLQGLPGRPGADGLTWYGGSGPPDGSLGSVGDFYMDSDNGTVSRKYDHGWTFFSDVRGPQGDPGPRGEQGLGWSAGGVPSASAGRPGELHLNAGTGDVYVKLVDGTWHQFGSLRGPQGESGAPGPAGSGSVLWRNQDGGSVALHDVEMREVLRMRLPEGAWVVHGKVVVNGAAVFCELFVQPDDNPLERSGFDNAGAATGSISDGLNWNEEWTLNMVSPYQDVAGTARLLCRGANANGTPGRAVHAKIVATQAQEVTRTST